MPLRIRMARAGTKVEDINRLLKMHRGMADMMKAMGSGKRGPLAALGNLMGFGGGMPSPEQLAEMAQKMPGGLPPGGIPGLPPGGVPGAPPGQGLPGLPKNMPGLPPNLPGLPGLGGGKLPGLGGFPGLAKKK